MSDDEERKRRAVVCDDDRVLRSVVGRVVTDIGFEVLAETEAPFEAFELASRFDVDLIVLDLSFPSGRGQDVIHALREKRLQTQVVVFSAYADEIDRDKLPGVFAVIDKPNFELLEAAVRELFEGTDVNGVWTGADRRYTDVAQRLGPPPAERSPSGLDTPADFGEVVAQARPGDTMIVLRLDGLSSMVRYGELFLLDHRIEVARALRACIRIQDRIHLRDDGTVTAVLVGGRDDAAQIVFGRVCDYYWSTGRAGVLHASYGICRDGEEPRVTLARTVGTLVAAGSSTEPILHES